MLAGPGRAVLVVDVQRDFCPGGALAVPRGDDVVAPINALVSAAHTRGLPVFATRDAHPLESSHFDTGGGPWPVHCVEGTRGAAWHPDLRLPTDVIVLAKGQAPDADGYSGFEAVDGVGRSLDRHLRTEETSELLVCGLATDYCVKATVLDAVERGLAVTLVTDGVAGVDVHPGDTERALDEMRRAGARLATSVDVIQALST